jgi:Dolichyl-phosphate-mannose-protein mannosyltransferase
VARIPILRRWNLTRRDAAILAAIGLATAAIYLPSIRDGWVFDDWSELVGNKLLRTWAFVFNSFRYDVWYFRDPLHVPQSVYYRPMQNVWFAANAALFGLHPAPWHLAKIVLHIVAVVLSFRVAQLITGDARCGLLTAAIFALMPAHVGGVAWASAIPEPLSTVFELAAMVFLIERKPGWSRGLFISALLFGCAMLTHESAILFPILVALYVFIFERADERTSRRIVLALTACAPFVVVTIAYACARLNALGAHFFFGTYHVATSLVLRGFHDIRLNYTPAQLLMTMPVVLLTYLAVLALPAMAGPTHAVAFVTSPQPIAFICAAVLIILAGAAFVMARRSSERRIYLFCAAWTLLTLAPALNLNSLFYLVDDRYLYAPSFGWSLAVAVAAMQLATTGARARIAVGTAMAMLLALYAVSTVQTERYWRDDIAFFQRCVEIQPSYLNFRLNLANSMNKAGDREGAARVLQEGTTIDPDNAPLRMRLAQQYQSMGRELDFEREFQKFNELSSKMIERHNAGTDSGASPDDSD